MGGIAHLCEYYLFDLYGVLTLTDMTDMIRGPRPLRDHVATVTAYLMITSTHTGQKEN